LVAGATAAVAATPSAQKASKTLMGKRSLKP
jgi:hypothetical protein